jgi:hypothetical protein|tara:strand:- start:1441 stop:1770 length:330 start_codon:yes stop_codon:yes gene_type:complete
MASEIFIPKREIIEAIQQHCDRIQEELSNSFDIGDPVQARHGRALWDSQVEIARDKLEARMELALGAAIDDIIVELDDGEFFAQAAIAIDEEETIPGVQQLSELCNPQR